MTTNSFACEQFDACLSELLEGTLDERTRAMADEHVTQCARCRGLLRDLTDLRADAAQLPLLHPSHDLWSGVSARIETPPIALHPAGQVRWWQSPKWLAAAAAVLMVGTSAVTWNVARRVDPVVAAVSSDSQPAQPSPSAQVAAAYDGEIAQLRLALDKRQPKLDATTAKVLADNMTVIDDAIARVRTALDASPASVLLSQQLARAYDMKLDLLRQVATMPIE